MLRHVFGAAFLAASVVACSPVPHYKTDPRISPADVAKRVYCELLLARNDTNINTLDLNAYKAAFSLGLKVESNVNPNVKADWVIPYHLTDTFTSGATAGVDDYVLRDSSVKYGVKVIELTPASCPSELVNAYVHDKESAQISYGSFGLLNWLADTAKTAKASGVQPTLDYYTVKFAVTTNGNPAPGFKIINMTGTLNLGLKRIDTHVLNIVFAANEPTKPQKVCVTNMPTATPCEPPPASPQKGTRKTDRFNTVIAPPSRPSTIDPTLDRKLENLQLRDILQR